MCPWKYPNVMIRIAKRKQATRLRINGTVGLLTCVLVTFVVVFVSVDVLLGVVDTGEPTSFLFCEVMNKDRERLDMWEEL